MTILLVLLLAIPVALLRGGRFSNLAQLSYHWTWLLFLPLAIQLVLFTPLAAAAGIERGAIPSLYAISMGLGAVVVWANRRLPGFWLLLAGLVSNLIVIVANGGYMPVSMPARSIAGLPLFSGVYNNVVEMTMASPLWFLGDILPIPRGLPTANVMSIGDILIMVGAVWFLQVALLPAREHLASKPPLKAQDPE